MRVNDIDRHEAELERSVSRGEAGFRLGCGLLLGSVAAFGYLLEFDHEGAVAAVLIMLGFGVVAILIGYLFWRYCVLALRAISVLYGRWW